MRVKMGLFLRWAVAKASSHERPPGDWVVGAPQQIGAGFVEQTVRHGADSDRRGGNRKAFRLSCPHLAGERNPSAVLIDSRSGRLHLADGLVWATPEVLSDWETIALTILLVCEW
jgi:hypothetical protein